MSVRFFIFLAFLLATSVAVADATPLKLGLAASLTGTGAPWGAVEVNGVTLALEDFNRNKGLDHSPVTLVVEDTGTNGPGTVTAIHKLVSQHGLRVIIGPTWLDSFGGPIPIARAKEILLISPSAAVEALRKNPDFHSLILSTFWNSTTEGEFLVDRMYRAGIRSIATVFDEDPYLQTMNEIVQVHMKRLGITVSANLTPENGATDLRSIITKLKALSPDAVIFLMANESSVLAFCKQRQELQLTVPIYSFHDFDGYRNSAAFKEALSGINYSVAVVHDKSFVTRYIERFKEQPILSAANAYDAAKMVLESWKEGHRTPQAIAGYLRSRSFQTVAFGETRFSADGQILAGDYEMVRLR